MDDGADFRLTAGRRSSSATGRAVAAAALRGVDPGLADAVAGERDWRPGVPGALPGAHRP